MGQSGALHNIVAQHAPRGGFFVRHLGFWSVMSQYVQTCQQQINELLSDLQSLQQHQARSELYSLLEHKLYGFHQNLKLVLRSFEIGQLAQQETAAINDSLFRQSLNSKQEKEHVAHVGHVQDNSANLLPFSIQAENSNLNPELKPTPVQNQATFLDDSDIQLLEEPKILQSFLEAQEENSKSLYEQEFQSYQDMTGWRVPKTHTKQRIAKNQYEGIKMFNSFAPLDQLSQTTNFHISDSGCCQYDEDYGNRKALKFKLNQKKGRDKLDFLRYLSNYGLTEKDLL